MLLCNFWKLLDIFLEFPKKFWTLSLYSQEQQDLIFCVFHKRKNTCLEWLEARVNYLFEVKWRKKCGIKKQIYSQPVKTRCKMIQQAHITNKINMIYLCFSLFSKEMAQSLRVHLNKSHGWRTLKVYQSTLK